MSYRPLVRAPQSDSLSLSLPLSPSRELSPASVTSCAWAGAFLVRRPAGGRADEALPHTAPGGPGRPATIDSAALQRPVEVETPSRSSRSSAAGGDLQ